MVSVGSMVLFTGNAQLYLRKPHDNSPETSSLVINSYAYFLINGELKLSVFKEREILVVSVLEARNMLSDCQESCNTYVKVGKFPDSDPKGRQKTPMKIVGFLKQVYDGIFNSNSMVMSKLPAVQIQACLLAQMDQQEFHNVGYQDNMNGCN
ncbi:hypothetical protein CCH79_00000956 [Gambusia affinis]|uniref:Uncharacterized protein n=1 Tax=Gambusia affinis TaxID=33528 RepID=A0A315VVS2_GAMAF|nr:hypothetical protein CCH79_00000956 [Gambusia affinis]